MAKEKIALVVDSTCGYSKKEAEKMGMFYVPVILTIDGKDFNDGVDVVEKDFIKTINTDMKIKTAAPSPKTFQDVYRKALKDHDKVFYFGYTSKMSGT
jgi:fatty acid-binding protein DegV